MKNPFLTHLTWGWVAWYPKKKKKRKKKEGNVEIIRHKKKKKKRENPQVFLPGHEVSSK